MAAKTTLTSLKKKKNIKKPGLKASSKAIESYVKRQKMVDDHNKKVDTELARRKKLLNK